MRRISLTWWCLCMACGSAEGKAAGDPDAGLVVDSGGAAAQDAAICTNEISSSEARCLEAVTGALIDESGAPLVELPTSVCGPICYSGTSDASGRFRVEVGRNVVLSEYSFLPHGRPHFASFYFPLPDGGRVIDIGERRVLRLPESGPELVVATDKMGAPAQTVTSGPVELSVADGVSVRLDVEDLLAPELGKQFRVLPIPQSFIEELTGDGSLLAVYAMSPFEASFEDEVTGEQSGARIGFDNTLGLDPGAELDVLALGSYLYPEWVTPARFEVVAAASVTGDGARIELDDGQSLPYLTWIALQAR